MKIELIKEKINHPMTRGLQYSYLTYVDGKQIPESYADDLEEAKEKYDTVVKSNGVWPKNVIISIEI